MRGEFRKVMVAGAALALAACGGGSDNMSGMEGTTAAVHLATNFDREFRSVPNTTVLLAPDAPPAFEQTEAGITVSHGGLTVTFTEADLGGAVVPAGTYRRDLENGDWVYLGQRSRNDPYEHLGIWDLGMVFVDGEGRTETVEQVRFVTGDATETMPVSGEASYAGRFSSSTYVRSAVREAGQTSPVSSRSDQTVSYPARFRMTASFDGDGASLSGEMDRFSVYTGQWAGTSDPVDGNLTFTATANGRSFETTEIDASNSPFADYELSLRGGFFGPDAAEVGGVMDGQSAERVLTGYIRARKSE